MAELPAPGAAPASVHDVCALVLEHQQRCLRAKDSAELGFVIANDAWSLLRYRQLALFRLDPFGQPQLTTVSGLVSVAEDTPFTLWLTRVCAAAHHHVSASGSCRLSASMLEPVLAESWSEWWPEHGALVPLTSPDGQRIGVVLLAREHAWEDQELELLDILSLAWSHCSWAFSDRRPPLAVYWARLKHHPRRRQLLLALAAAMLFPVRLSALAPAEIIPLQAEAVSSPLDGVVKTFHVPPNTRVTKGQVLFSLDDTTLRNRRDVAQKTLGVARADALAAQQKAFDSVQSKGDLAILLGRVKEKEAELAYLDETLARIDVKAALDGIFVYGDPNDWLGKPVITGERVAQLAQPNDLGVLAWLPVGDAINLEPGASIRVYLQTAPLSALSAELVQTSYQATISPDGVASFRIRGRLEAGSEAHLGIRGVAKVYGGWRPLIYWMLRRPLGVLRQWLGV